MPLYEYKCEKCGVHIEKLQGINDEPLKVCDKKIEPKNKSCGGELKKMISQTSFQLKGGGWYKDGYSK